MSNATTKTAVTVATVITSDNLADMLEQEKKAMIFSLTGDVEIAMNLGGRQHLNTMMGKARKVVKYLVIGGFTYETVVNNARIKEAVTRIMDNIDNDAVLAKLLEDFTKADIQEAAKGETKKFVAMEHGFASPVNGSKYILAYGKGENQDLNRKYMKLLVLSAKTIRKYNSETGQVLSETELEMVNKYKKVVKVEGARQGLLDPKIYRNIKMENVINYKHGEDNFKIIKTAKVGEVVDTKTPETAKV
jgi:hypothetical protein